MLVLLNSSAAFAATYYVDSTNPNATDSGSGSSTIPYKTIQAAVTARGTAGNTILVRPAIYRETVTLSQSGSSSSRIVLQASPVGAAISGSDDFSTTGKWVNVAGGVYLASTVTWQPAQVFSDGTRLASSPNPPASIPANSYRYVAGIGLYVNVGGGNPGLHVLEVGRRLNGVVVNGSYVTLDAFIVTQTEDKAVYVTNGNALIQNNTVSFANKFGIQLSGSASSTVLRNIVRDNNDHGIFLSDASSSAKIQNNECFWNSKPDLRSANGINISASTSVTVENNRCHDNQDSGIQFVAASNSGISRNNISWYNGDHGYDHLASSGVKHIHDVAYGNYKDGFSFEGQAPSGSMYNCIAVENGLTTNEYDLWVDDASFVGFVSNNNIIWNSTTQTPIKIGTSLYSTVSAYASAKGQESAGKQADPKFLSPSQGNFHLISGSPAIDCARAGVSSWPTTDAEGNARVDDSATSNTGSGTPNYADRGALEYRPSGSRPVASLRLTPTSGESPLLVNADGSLSTDSDGTIAAYWFDWGDGVIVGPQSSPLASHTFGPGTWSVRLTVADNLGQTATATVRDTVAQGDNPPTLTAPLTSTIEEGQTLQIQVTASDPDGQPIDTLKVNLSQLPNAASATFTTNPSRTSGLLTWTPPTGSARTNPYNVTFTAKNAKSTSAVTAITVRRQNLFPTAALSVSPRSGNAPLTVTADALASSDPDGAILTYRFDFGDGTIVGPQAGAAATHTYTTGNWNVQVIVTDDAGAGSISAPVAVQALGQGTNKVTNPGFETNTTGWNATGPDTVFRVAGGHTGGFCLEMRSATSNSVTLFGANDSPDAVNPSGAAGTRYHYECWVRSASHRGNAKIRIREYNGGVLQGTGVLSTPVTLSPTWQKLQIDYTTQATNSTIDCNILDAPVAAGEIFQVDDIVAQSTATSMPVVTVPAIVSGSEGFPISFNVTASDPDGEAIAALTADMTGLPAGHNATFTPNAAKTQGTFSWTPTTADGRAAAYNVRFVATNSGSGQAIAPIVVSNVDHPPVVVSPATATVGETQTVSVTVTASDSDGEPLQSLSANLAGLPAGHNAVFTPNATSTSGTLTWTPSTADGPASYSVVFTVANALSASDTTVINVTNLDRAPVVGSPPTAEGMEGQALSIAVSAADPDGDAIASLGANLAVLPSGHNAVFTRNAANTAGTLTWTPTAADSGTYSLVFTGANAMSGRDTTVIQVSNVDRAPIVSAAASVAGSEGQLLTVTVTASDPDGDPIQSLTANLAGLPAGANAVFTPNASNTSGTLTWTPAFTDYGTYAVTFTASNGQAGSASTGLQVANVDRAPVLVAPATAFVGEGDTLVLVVTVSDPDGEPITNLSANLNGLPPTGNPQFTVNPGNTGGTVRWRAAPGDWIYNPLQIPFSASNQLSATVTTSVTVDRRPVVTAPATATGTEGQQVSVTVTAFDPNAQAITSLTADLSGLPSGNNAVFTPNASMTAGTLTWTPTLEDAPGPYSVTFTASNTSSGKATTSFQVANVDRPPVVVAPLTIVAVENELLSLTITASDPDHDAIADLSADLSGLPAGHDAVFTPNATNTGGTLTWTPRPADQGSYPIRFTASNSVSGSATTTPTIDHRPRVTAFTSVNGLENQPLVLNITATDPDGDAITSLTARLNGLPPGHNAIFTPNASKTGGTLTWTPSFADAPGSYRVAFVASNTVMDSAATSITVANVDRPPVVTSPDGFVAEGALLSVNITAADPDGDAIESLTANLDSLPPGHDAAFVPNVSRTGGTLTWSPRVGDGAGGPYRVWFTATNALSGASRSSIQVDRAPVVDVPTTAAALESQPVTIVVHAADPDGQPIASLTANLAGLPAGHGAVFTPSPDHTTGTLVWTPDFYDAPGPYNVTFTATNTLASGSSTSIEVVNVDRAPVVTAAAAVKVAEGALLTLQVTAVDPDGDPLSGVTADLGSLPALHDALFTPNATNTGGVLTWTPAPSAAPGPYSVTFTADNDMSGSATSVVTIDRHPVVTVDPAPSVTERSVLSLTVTAFDPDGDPVTSLAADRSGLPPGNDATFTPNAFNTGGTFQWTPGYADAPGPYGVSFTAIAGGLSSAASSSVAVQNLDRAPVVIAPVSALARTGNQLSLNVSASDPDGDSIAALTADLSGLPSGDALFTSNADHTGGTLTWTPVNGDGHGPFSVTFTATNARSGSAVTLVTNDRPPVVGVASAVAVFENQQLTLPVTASDPDGDPILSLGAGMTGLPSGHNAVFTPNAGNTGGTFTWTPTYSDGGAVPYAVTITASNVLSSSAATAIQVNNVDRSPTVSVAPTAFSNEGQPLSVQVTASDPDGDAIASLGANLSSLPAGHNALFTPNAENTSGTLSWTPAASSGRIAPYAVTFTAGNAMSGSGATAITVNAPPVAALSLSPSTGSAPLSVTANAGGSTDADGTIVSYLFQFGDGTSIGPQSSPIASHSYAAGSFTATVTVTDNRGSTGSASASVNVSALPPNVVTNPGFETGTSGWAGNGSATLTRVSPGHGGSFCLNIATTSSSTFGITDDPAWVPTVTAAGITYHLSAWVRSAAHRGNAKIKVREFVGSTQQGSSAYSNPVVLSPTWQQITFDYVTRVAGSALDIEVNDYPIASSEIFQVDDIVVSTAPPAPDQPPFVIAPGTASVNENGQLTLNVTAGDPDGNGIGSLTANLTGLPAGHNAVFIPNGTNTGGTLTWTPSFAHGRAAPYTVTFTASNALTGAASTAITVQNVDRAPAVTAPASVAAQKNVPLSVTISAADPDGDTIASLTANLSGLPAGHNAVFTPNGTNTGGTFTWTPQAGDGPGPYSVTFTAANALSGSAASAISVTNPPVVSAPLGATVNENQQLTLTVTASDVDGDAISSLTANLSGLPAGHNAVFTVNATKTSGTLAWTPTFVDGRAAPYAVTFTAANAASGSATTAITVSNVDRPPVVTAPATASVSEGGVLTVNVTAADPDSQSIASLTADLSGLPPGHNAVFTANASRTGGTLTWTPTASDGRASPPYNVTFTAANALSASAVTAITVNDVPAGGTNLVGNPGFETGTNGWLKNGTATLTRLSPGHGGSFCLEIATTSSSTFGITDDPAWVPTVTAAGITYHLTAWVRSAAHHGNAKIKVREFVGSTQQGSSAYSNPVVLSPTWQQITFDYVTRTAGSALDIEVNDYPIASSEIFQVDDIVVEKVTVAQTMALQTAMEPTLQFAVSLAPNPVRSEAVLSYTITRPGAVRVQIFDVSGRLVQEPVNEQRLPAGRHQVTFSLRRGGVSLQPGAYFYRLHAPEGTRGGKFMLVQ